jgi:cell wall-associated NlpC family hydrolase
MIHHSSTSTKRLRRTAIAAAVLGVVCISNVAGPAGAAPHTQSEAIATEATRAMTALDEWNDNHNPADYVRFVQSRELTAMMTASDLEVDAASMRDQWAAAPAQKQAAVLAAVSQMGVPYKSLKSDPEVGFDCSGLTIWAYDAAGVEIPRVSGDQIRAAADTELVDAEPGDLVYYPGHVGLYLGAGTYIHSPETGSDVQAAHLPDKSLRFGDFLESD